MSSSENTSLVKQCMDFFQHLNSQGKMFSFSLSLGPMFSFSLDTKQKTTTVIPVVRKKSPSTLKRNLRRREEYLKKKAEPIHEKKSTADEHPVETRKTTEETTVHMEEAGGQVLAFTCEICDYRNETLKGLKQHIAKKHKEYKCEKCNFRNLSKEVLKQHENQEHPPPKIYKCIMCEESVTKYWHKTSGNHTEIFDVCSLNCYQLVWLQKAANNT